MNLGQMFQQLKLDAVMRRAFGMIQPSQTPRGGVKGRLNTKQEQDRRQRQMRKGMPRVN